MSRNGRLGQDAKVLLRKLPSVDRLLAVPAGIDLITQFGRDLTVEGLRTVLDVRRRQIMTGEAGLPMNATLLGEAKIWLLELVAPTLRPVINGTGIIVHTNLGRAPLSVWAMKAIQEVAGGYTNLEYDVPAGKRGSRTVHAHDLLTRLTGAEDALVVNNNASSVLLMLTALCAGKEVIISRGQLVEIGGGFRVPDVMAQSGAKLVEVGTTNRTHLRDYEAAITDNTGAILVVHHSNYKIVGFTSEPSLPDLTALGRERALPVLYDQGGGALLDTAKYGLVPEPTVQEAIAVGCDVVAFSGDKLLGGPQAGILTGRADFMAQLKKHPLARAMRADKLCLAALASTLRSFVSGRATKDIPVWQMIAKPLRDIEKQAGAWAEQLQAQGVSARVIEGQSAVGGGSLPGATLPTKLLAIDHPEPDKLAGRLRQNKPPLIGRIAEGQFLLDPRTILPTQVGLVEQALRIHT